MIVAIAMIGWILLGLLNIRLRLYVWGFWGPLNLFLLVLAGPCATIVFAIPALMVRQGIYERTIRLGPNVSYANFEFDYPQHRPTYESGIQVLRAMGKMK